MSDRETALMTPPSPYDGDTSPSEWGGKLTRNGPAIERV